MKGFKVKFGTKVVFENTTEGKKYIGTVVKGGGGAYVSIADEQNDIIFKVMGIDGHKLAEEAYGYLSEFGGAWPYAKHGGNKAIGRLLKLLSLIGEPQGWKVYIEEDKPEEKAQCKSQDSLKLALNKVEEELCYWQEREAEVIHESNTAIAKLFVPGAISAANDYLFYKNNLTAIREKINSLKELKAIIETQKK